MTVSDVDEKEGAKTADAFKKSFGDDKAHFVRCDVTSTAEFNALWDASEKFFAKSVDALVNNAGINHLSGWKKCMDIDILSNNLFTIK